MGVEPTTWTGQHKDSTYILRVDQTICEAKLIDTLYQDLIECLCKANLILSLEYAHSTKSRELNYIITTRLSSLVLKSNFLFMYRIIKFQKWPKYNQI